MNATERTDGILSRAARELAQNPQVIAAALARHQAQQGLDDAALAAWLGVSVARLHGLALCRRRARHDPLSPAEVAAIARYIGWDPPRLHTILAAYRPPD